MICEDKILYENDEQIMYRFHESEERKKINEVNLSILGDKKSFMIFENSFITIVETSNIGENLLILGYLHEKYSDNKEKIRGYARSLL